ncbi:MAG: hydrolase [Tepidiforma sp.]|nr:alpha/beta fold hydrolase [Tepidiforma sp.]GIW18386.1 MAG: hydrolase [Tepidiforma sp.]
MRARRLLGGAVLAGAAGGGALAGLAAADRRRWRPPAPRGFVREVDGAQLHYLDEGSGPALVLVHGFAGSTFSWRAAVPELAKEFRVIAVDLPGFGLSDRRRGIGYGHERHAARLLALLDLLGIERAAFAGHSMGGAVVQRLAARAPGRAERLVLVGSVSAGEGLEFRRRRRAGRVAFGLIGLAATSPTVMYALGRRGLRQMVADPGFVTDEVVRGYIDPLLIPGTVRAVGEMAREQEREPLVDLAAVAAPALVVTGERDVVVPPARAEALAASLPGAQDAIVIERAGHLLAEERPDAFLRAVLPFLRAGAGAQPRR